LIFIQFISDIKYKRNGTFTVCAYVVYNSVCSSDCSGFSTMHHLYKGTSLWYVAYNMDCNFI